jgi:hypothetical protein
MGDPNRDDAGLDAVSAAQNANRVGMPLADDPRRRRHHRADRSQSILMQFRRCSAPASRTRLITLHDIDHYASPNNGEAWRTVLTEALGFFNEHIGPGVPPPAHRKRSVAMRTSNSPFASSSGEVFVCAEPIASLA